MSERGGEVRTPRVASLPQETQGVESRSPQKMILVYTFRVWKKRFGLFCFVCNDVLFSFPETVHPTFLIVLLSLAKRQARV